jgi:signal transduction histidine kinase
MIFLYQQTANNILTTSAQIRLLLAVLCVTFLLTAVIVKETFTPGVNLTQTGIRLAKHLHEKEEIVDGYINHRREFQRLKQLTASNHQADAIRLIEQLTNRGVWLFTYKNNQLSFWSGVRILPQSPAPYKEGPSFIKEVNGYYQVIRKTEGDFTALFFIPVKSTYAFQNKYFHNTFNKDLLTDNNVDIADISDNMVYNVRSVNHHYLFSIKLKPGNINHQFYYFEIILWILGFLTLCTLIHNLCTYIANKGHTIISFITLAIFIAVTRFINLHYNWPDLSSFEVFNPKLYASSAVFRSLGDFTLNILAICWLAAFVYYNRFKILRRTPGVFLSYLILTGGCMVIVIMAYMLLNLFNGLVINSSISFDVTNVFNLSGFSLLGVLMLCFSFLLFYLLNDTFLVIVKRLVIPTRQKVIIFILFVVGATAFTFIQHAPSVFYILTGLFTAIRAYSIWQGSGKLHAGAFLSLLAICSVISAIKLNTFQAIKETRVRQELINKLEVADDATSDEIFGSIEEKIIADTALVNYFNPNNRNDEYLKNYLQKSYFDGYLSRYDLKMYVFNKAGQSITNDKNYLLDDFKDLVAYSSIKVSNYFYYENNSFGFQSYFAILPVYNKHTVLGTLVVSLVSKPIIAPTTFSETLVNGEIKSNIEFKDYSYAFYTDISKGEPGHLLNQSGKYVYSLVNNEFVGRPKEIVIKNTPLPNPKWFAPMAHYNHFIYMPDGRSMIVVSRQEDPISQSVTSLTFFFVALLSFSSIVIFISWLWTRIRIFNVKSKRLKWGFKINVDRILYRSRIQFSVVVTVVITVLLIGAITFQSISSQYKDQQDEMIREKITRIGAAFEVGLQKNYYSTTLNGQVKFNEFADTYAVDLTLYNSNGVPLITTQPKIYYYNLQARKMNSRAYIVLNREHKSEFLNDEELGDLSYKAAYVPVKSARDTTVVGYLQLPYFANEADYNDRIGALLNAMINVYALVFIAIGLFAVVIARQITSPLTFIQHNLSRTIYGQKNEPIVWDRDDEIGALVKEYNKMIAELEASAQRLAQSERETAWREMAKQVAHEIKNPLTPLKLGLQLLDKAWKDKDPKFDQKFERFSKSFVEQIESLSSIASEFSSFAKMPDTKLEKINIFEIINQAVIIFKQMDNVTIAYYPSDPFLILADRDQLLRCFNNLLKNAIEAIPAERHGVISIAHRISKDNVLIIVTDNGNGIPEDLREKIFAPNFTTKSSGTGLGLAFVKNSIENAGGKVWFETALGKGTTFYISMPAVNS